MKNCLALFLALFLCNSLFAQIATSETEAIAKSEQRKYRQSLTNKLQTANGDFDVVYYRCNWSVDPTVNTISGGVTTYFKPLSNNFDTLLFDMSNALSVSFVSYHGAAISYNHIGDVLTCFLTGVSAAQQQDSQRARRRRVGRRGQQRERRQVTRKGARRRSKVSTQKLSVSYHPFIAAMAVAARFPMCQ